MNSDPYLSYKSAESSETSSSQTSTSLSNLTYKDNKEALSSVEVVELVKDSVVEIRTETVSMGHFMGQYVSTGAGSGVIVSEEGFIVTNHHVVEGAQSIRVRLNDETEYDAVLIKSDDQTDLAVIQIRANNLKVAVLGKSSEVKVGQAVLAIGNPLGELGGTVTSGIISALDREITVDGHSMSLLQTDTAINPGNSGGGLFNMVGELVGVVNAKSSGSEIEGLGFAIPVDTVKSVYQDIIEFGYVRGRINTGLTLLDIQDRQMAMAYRVNYLGLYIYGSTRDEFKVGDRIVALNGQELGSLAEWNQLLAQYKIGDTIELSYIRSGESGKGQLFLDELTD